MLPGISALYESVSIYPPKDNLMTVCYGFVCRRRETFEFTAADRKALEAIMAKGKASAEAERSMQVLNANFGETFVSTHLGE